MRKQMERLFSCAEKYSFFHFFPETFLFFAVLGKASKHFLLSFGVYPSPEKADKCRNKEIARKMDRQTDR